jgi:hypothetical protein
LVSKLIDWGVVDPGGGGGPGDRGTKPGDRDKAVNGGQLTAKSDVDFAEDVPGSQAGTAASGAGESGASGDGGAAGSSLGAGKGPNSDRMMIAGGIPNYSGGPGSHIDLSRTARGLGVGSSGGGGSGSKNSANNSATQSAANASKVPEGVSPGMAMGLGVLKSTIKNTEDSLNSAAGFAAGTISGGQDNVKGQFQSLPSHYSGSSIGSADLGNSAEEAQRKSDLQSLGASVIATTSQANAQLQSLDSQLAGLNQQAAAAQQALASAKTDEAASNAMQNAKTVAVEQQQLQQQMAQVDANVIQQLGAANGTYSSYMQNWENQGNHLNGYLLKCVNATQTVGDRYQHHLDILQGKGQ